MVFNFTLQEITIFRTITFNKKMKIIKKNWVYMPIRITDFKKLSVNNISLNPEFSHCYDMNPE